MEIETRPIYAKPMNCPFHIMIYRLAASAATATCRIRWAELGTVYRYEQSGVLHGLMRVRGLHPGRRPPLRAAARRWRRRSSASSKFALYMLRSFGFEEFEAYVATRPEKYVGDRTRTGRRPRPALRGRRRGRWAQIPLCDEGGGRLLRAQDRHQDQGRHRPLVAALDRPVRLQPARSASTSSTSAPDNRAPPARHDPPGAPREPRALLRHPDRALRRRVPPLARARAGPPPSHRGPTCGILSERVAADSGRRGSASRWTPGPRRRATRSARPSSRRSPTCSSSGTGSRRLLRRREDAIRRRPRGDAARRLHRDGHRAGEEPVRRAGVTEFS